METQNIASETTLAPKTRLSGKVLKTTLAGALIDVGQNIPGVIHISQLSEEPVNKVEDVVREGQMIDVWVRRVKKDRIELTMIKPLGLEWKEIEPDMVVKGKVVRLEAYGAFVDIGAERPGMVHVSELTHGYVKTPNEVVKEGDEVEAKVLDVNRKKKQIKLSIKALEPIIEEFKPAKKEDNKVRGKRGPKKERDVEETVQQEEPKEPELTGMQVAWQEALNKANEDKSFKVKRAKSNRSQEQDDILSRTLEKRLPTGG